METQTVQSVLQLFYQRQVNRYRQKGPFNIAIALILLFIIIYGGTLLGQYLWPEEIPNPALFTLTTTLTIHVVFQLLYFLIFLPGYLGCQNYQKYKITPNAKNPWQNQNWKQLKLRTILFLFLNKGLVFPLVIYLSLKLGGTKTRFVDFPSPWQVFYQLLFIIMVEDFFFFWAHKINHDFPALYKYHKIHHQYEQLFSLAAEYTHPIDYILGVLIPSAMPFVFLGQRAHCFVLMFWQIWKIFISSQGHCGFEFPFSPTRILPLVSGSSYHDFHHTHNVGNFAGSVYFWDTIMGTNEVYFKRLEVKDQKEQ